MKTKIVRFSVEYETTIEYTDESDLNDRIADIEIPENDSCVYVENSFSVNEDKT